MSPRRKEVELGDTTGGSGIKITVTRKGIDVFGWYDCFVGLEGKYLTWAEIERARAVVNQVDKEGE